MNNIFKNNDISMAVTSVLEESKKEKENFGKMSNNQLSGWLEENTTPSREREVGINEMVRRKQNGTWNGGIDLSERRKRAPKLKHIEDPLKKARRLEKEKNPYKKYDRKGNPTKKHQKMMGEDEQMDESSKEKKVAFRKAVGDKQKAINKAPNMHWNATTHPKDQPKAKKKQARRLDLAKKVYKRYKAQNSKYVVKENDSVNEAQGFDNPHDWDVTDIRQWYDQNPNATLKQLSNMTGKSVASLKKILMSEAKKLDKVEPKQLKKDWDERISDDDEGGDMDDDIDNDGDEDESDEYLHKKRKAISKSMDESKSGNFHDNMKGKTKLNDMRKKALEKLATDYQNALSGDDDRARKVPAKTILAKLKQMAKSAKVDYKDYLEGDELWEEGPVTKKKKVAKKKDTAKDEIIIDGDEEEATISKGVAEATVSERVSTQVDKFKMLSESVTE